MSKIFKYVDRCKKIYFQYLLEILILYMPFKKSNIVQRFKTVNENVEVLNTIKPKLNSKLNKV